MSSDLPHNGTSTRVLRGTASTPQCCSSNGITDSWCHPVRPSFQRCNQYSAFMFRARKGVSSYLGFVADHFNVVPVRPDDKRRVVSPAVVRAQARRPVVHAARFQRCAMECLDLATVFGPERQVQVRGLLVSRKETQRSLAIRAELDSERSFRYHLHADRFERLQEECFARGVVADSEYNVVEHGFSGGVWSCEVAQPSSKRTLPVASSYSAPTTRTRLLFTASAMIGCAEATREALYATFASIARSSKPSPPPFTMFAMPGRTASVMSQMWPGRGFGSWISWIAALMAPQLLWPSTSTSGVPSTPTPYSRLDSASGLR